MHEIIRLLTEFYTDAKGRVTDAGEALIALAQRFIDRNAEEDPAAPLSDEELAALLDGLTALAANDEASAALLVEARDVVREARTEEAARAEVLAAEEAEREAARRELLGETDQDETEGDDEGDETEGDTDGEGETPAEPVEAPPVEEATEVEPVEAVAASAARAPRAARRALRAARPAAADAPPDTADHAVIRMLDGAAGHTIGQTVESFRDVNRGLTERFGTFRHSKPNGEPVLVARVEGHYPQERRLIDDQGRLLAPHIAQERIDAAISAGLSARTPALVAAGAPLCAPLTPYYGVPVLGDDRRPIRDSALVGFQATRGGLVSLDPPLLPDLAGSAVIWTLEDNEDALTDPDFVKPCLRITCGEQRTSEIYAVPVCLTIDNFMARTNGEWVGAWGELSMVNHARVAEVQLFALIQGLSTNKTVKPQTISATRDILNYIARIVANQRIRNRIPATYPFRLILPEIVQTILQEDLANALPGGSFVENLTVSAAQIQSFFTVRNIAVTWTPDLSIPEAEADNAAAVAFPSTVPFAAYPEGTFLFIENGTLDLGLQRSPETNVTNDFQTFTETFEGVHHLGFESFTGSVQLCPSGAVNGTLDPTGFCGDAS